MAWKKWKKRQSRRAPRVLEGEKGIEPSSQGWEEYAFESCVWFFQTPNSNLEAQIESSTGMFPFLIETNENDTQATTTPIAETIETLARLLHLKTANKTR